MSAKTCSKCVYFSGTDNDQVGFCRRFPPVIPIMQEVGGSLAGQPARLTPVSFSPPVKATAWCGEYAPKLGIADEVN